MSDYGSKTTCPCEACKKSRAAEQVQPIPFHDWWSSQGRFIDPDTEDVPWYDKREALCEAAYDAGQSSVRFAEAYKQPTQPPAEQTDEQKVAIVLKRHEHAVTSHTALAAEIVAALKAGKHD